MQQSEEKRLKEKCNVLIKRVQEYKEKIELLEKRKLSDPPEEGVFMKTLLLPELQYFTDIFMEVTSSCLEKGLFQDFTERSRFAGKYMKVEYGAFEKEIAASGMNKDNFLDSCVLLNLMERDGGKRAYSNGNGRIYVIRKDVIDYVASQMKKAESA